MKYVLTDHQEWEHLLPLTFTRPISSLRVGIITIAEKWAKHLAAEIGIHTQDYLQSKFPGLGGEDILLINSAICPNAALLDLLSTLQPGQGIRQSGVLIAQRSQGASEGFREEGDWREVSVDFTYINRPWKIFSENARELQADFALLTKGRHSAELSSTNTLIGDQIFVEEGVQCEAAILNSLGGPIYLGTHSEIMEGSVVRGGLALCEHASLKLGAKIYGATTIGPHSKVGGEVNNSVILGYSNKGHDGFLGNAVLGEWCNLGADTNNSNLKNNYEEVKLWSYPRGGFEKTGLQFCGLIMGDHSKCGINTMFNTGTVVGVSANIFGAGFPRNFIPSFSWGGPAGFSTYQLEKALQTARLVMQRRQIELSGEDQAVLQHIFDKTAVYR